MSELLPRWLVVTQRGDGDLIGRMTTVHAENAAAAVASAHLHFGPPAGTASAIAFLIPNGGTRIPLIVDPGHWSDEPDKWGTIT